MTSRTRLSIASYVAALLLLIAPNAVWADSWDPPSVEQYLSPDGATRLTVTPDKPGEYSSPGPVVPPEGLLETRGTDGEWAEVWRRKLVNRIAPVGALICDNARCVVTIDNWYDSGYGDDVVVLYDREGNLVREMGLDDFLSPEHIKSLSRTVGSILWSGEHRLSADQTQLELSVVPQRTDPWDDEFEHDTILFSLEDGKMILDQTAQRQSDSPLLLLLAFGGLALVCGGALWLSRRRSTG